MATPPRRPPRTRERTSSRLASLFFGIGCLVVLGVTFAAGVAVGRRWPATLSTPSDVAGMPAKGGERRAEGQGLAKTIADSPPVLTFYRELTAPLAPSTPTVRPAPAKPEAKSKSTEKPKETLKPRPVETAKPAPPPPAAAPSESADGRFTVQVGVFKTRGQADALRTRLASNGQQAYVSEIEADGAMQYRVRVGSFATREAARDAAIRLASERQLATYVTSR
jgi:cell division septation protein DedD